jgi:restriction endonuclease S subunit
MTRLPVAPGDRSVPWRDVFPPTWQLKPIKYACCINRRALPETTDPDAEFRYVDISSVDSEGNWSASEPMRFGDAPSRARRIVADGDVLVSTVRTYLRAIAHVDKVDEPLICSTGFAVLSANGAAYSKFLAYWARSVYFVDEVVARSVGVSYPAVNASDVGNIPYPLLPHDEQRAIARFLNRETARIDKLIEKKRRQIELLHEKRVALISQAVTKGLDPNAPMKDSGFDWLGEVPEHWDIKRLKFLLAEPLKYGASEAAELDDPMLPRYIRITDVDENGGLREETFKSIPEEVARPYLLREGDLLLARSGATVGKSFYYEPSWGRAAYAGYLIRARFDIPRTAPRFIMYFTNSSQYWQWLNLSLIQATIENVSAEKYANLIVPFPPLNEQRVITAYLDSETTRTNALITKVNLSIDRLREYRTALISAAVTGKIDVRKEVA